jgi:hypothetical protein
VRRAKALRQARLIGAFAEPLDDGSIDIEFVCRPARLTCLNAVRDYGDSALN